MCSGTIRFAARKLHIRIRLMHCIYFQGAARARKQIRAFPHSKVETTLWARFGLTSCEIFQNVRPASVLRLTINNVHIPLLFRAKPDDKSLPHCRNDIVICNVLMRCDSM